jgi:hypothetical protein
LTTVPPRELVQVRRRLQVLDELLQEYQPPSVLDCTPITLSELDGATGTSAANPIGN